MSAEFSRPGVRAPADAEAVDRLMRSLQRGEAEAIALELRMPRVLIDESAGRARAEQLGLTPFGALGVLLRAKETGLVSTVAPLMDRLREGLRFFISGPLREEILRLAGESEPPG